jgi:Carboxypeptidase regulatory-like domain/TonB dependent receptor-like, beta-barrel
MKSPSESRSIAIYTVAVVALILLFTAPVYSQVAGATLSGTVTDPSGAAIPNAQVTIKNTSTGVTQNVTTNSAGFYTAPNLLPGTYDVTFSAAGFATVTESGLVLAVGEQHSLNRAMQVGQATQKVEVTAAAATVQLATSTITGEVNSTTVRELPLNGRDWTSLATLQAGVVPVRTQVSATSANAPRSGRGFGTAISDAGHRPNSNNFRINGISVLDYANSSPGSVLGGALGVDAISEFNVLTSGYTSEYGHTLGGVVTAITKSGTNSFHGNAYWFIREKNLAARNFFAAELPPFHRNNYGASIGGPIKKDKTFFFFDYERMLQDQSIANHDLVPSPAARRGILSTGNVTVSPLVAPYLALYPLPNAGLLPSSGGDVGVFNTVGLQHFVENYENARIDHKISDKDSLAGSFFHDYGPYSQPDTFDDSIGENTVFREMFSLEETHVFSASLVNTARVGYNRDVGFAGLPVSAINPVAADSSLSVFPGTPGLYAPILTVPGLTQMNGALGSLSRSKNLLNSYQAYDDAFLTKGTHSLKFGFAYERQQDNGQTFSRPNGTFKFPDLTGFLTDTPTNFQFPIPGSSHEIGTRQSIFGAYLQDDWRARSNLTLNLGLRYEPLTLPYEVHNLMQSIPDADFYTGPAVPVHTYWKNNATLKDFEPRVGFSWDPFRNGKTAVRGGFGIYDDLPTLWLYSGGSLQQSLPNLIVITVGNLPAGSFPTGAVAGAGLNPAKAQQRYVPSYMPLPYAVNWNFSIQREITPSLTAMIGYVGSRTNHNPNTPDDSNLVLPTLTPQGYLWPCDATFFAKGKLCTGHGNLFNQSVGDIRATYWSGFASYEGLQAQLTKKFSHGFQAQASFSYGKCIDDGSGGSFGDEFANSPASLLWFDEASKVGLCDFNVGKNFVFNYVYDAPTPKFGGRAASFLLGGWELAGIFTAGTGTPFTPLISGDPVGMGGDPWPFTNRLAGCNAYSSNYRSNILVDSFLNLNCFPPPTVPASFPNYATSCQPAAASVNIPFTCMNLNGNAGRNELTGPGLANFDFSLIKNTYIRKISESFNVQFRAEVFNILNRANFQSPLDNNYLLDQHGSPVGGAGLIDATSTDPREIQLALKIIW